MFKQLPFKKEYLLVAGSVILVVISYQLAFKRTIEAWQLHGRLKKELELAAGVVNQPAYLERKNYNLGQIINLYKTDTTTFRSNTISAIASIAEKENVKLSEVPTQDPIYHSDSFLVEKLDFEGDFFALCKVFDRLESEKNIGVPRSALFKVVRFKPGEESSRKLVMEIYFEAAK